MGMFWIRREYVTLDKQVVFAHVKRFEVKITGNNNNLQLAA